MFQKFNALKKYIYKKDLDFINPLTTGIFSFSSSIDDSGN